MSLDELSTAIGVSPANISRICTGKIRSVRFATTDAICKYFECDYGDLFCYIPDDQIKDDDVVCYRESEEYDYFE